MKKDKIVQLVEVTKNVRGRYMDGGKLYYAPIIALGLKESGEIVPLTIDDMGVVHEIDEPINFKEVVFY